MKKCNFALAIFILGLGPASFSQENPPVSIQTEIPAFATKKASSKITFETPNNLAKNLLEALRENDAAKLKSAVPTPEQLRVWFETVSDDDPINVRQKEWLIDRSKSLLSGKAEEILAKIRKKAATQNIDFSEGGIPTAEISKKYFYEESDILVQLANGRKLKIKDCIKTPSGWRFVSELNLKK